MRPTRPTLRPEPACPEPGRRGVGPRSSLPSYSCWARAIVPRAPKAKRREAREGALAGLAPQAGAERRIRSIRPFDRAQGRLRQQRVQGPVLLRLEPLYLALAVGDHAQRGRLHAPGGEPLPHLAPEQGADLVADEPVQDAPRILNVDGSG